jgi:hypothetical protein
MLRRQKTQSVLILLPGLLASSHDSSTEYHKRFNWEVLAVEVGLSMPAERVVRILHQLKMDLGVLEKVKENNGPEFLAKMFHAHQKD